MHALLQVGPRHRQVAGVQLRSLASLVVPASVQKSAIGDWTHLLAKPRLPVPTPAAATGSPSAGRSKRSLRRRCPSPKQGSRGLASRGVARAGDWLTGRPVPTPAAGCSGGWQERLPPLQRQQQQQAVGVQRGWLPVSHGSLPVSHGSLPAPPPSAAPPAQGGLVRGTSSPRVGGCF